MTLVPMVRTVVAMGDSSPAVPRDKNAGKDSASDDTEWTGNKTWKWGSASATPTDGADNAGVPCRDWLLVDVQETEMFQEGVSHAGIQLLALDKGVWHRHGLWVAPHASCSERENVVSGVVSLEHSTFEFNWTQHLLWKKRVCAIDEWQNSDIVLRVKSRDQTLCRHNF